MAIPPRSFERGILAFSRGMVPGGMKQPKKDQGPIKSNRRMSNKELNPPKNRRVNIEGEKLQNSTFLDRYSIFVFKPTWILDPLSLARR